MSKLCCLGSLGPLTTVLALSGILFALAGTGGCAVAVDEPAPASVESLIHKDCRHHSDCGCPYESTYMAQQACVLGCTGVNARASRGGDLPSGEPGTCDRLCRSDADCPIETWYGVTRATYCEDSRDWPGSGLQACM